MFFLFMNFTLNGEYTTIAPISLHMKKTISQLSKFCIFFIFEFTLESIVY